MSILNEFRIARVDREIRYIVSEIDSGAIRKVWVDPHPPVPQILAMAYGADHESAGGDFWDLLENHVLPHRQLGFSMTWDFLEAAADCDLSDLQFDDIDGLRQWMLRLANVVQRTRICDKVGSYGT